MIIGDKKSNSCGCPLFLIHIYHWWKPFRCNVCINEGGKIFILNWWCNRVSKEYDFLYIAFRAFGRWFKWHKIYKDRRTK